jgi:putative FmdB family regulatory protein
VPIYEYRCPNGHTFEVFQRMTDPPVDGCEVCGAGPVEKVLFPVAVHFKGKGFYSTDYGRGSRPGAGKEGDAAAPAKESTSSDSGTGREKKAASGDDGGGKSTSAE